MVHQQNLTPTFLENIAVQSTQMLFILLDDIYMSSSILMEWLLAEALAFIIELLIQVWLFQSYSVGIESKERPQRNIAGLDENQGTTIIILTWYSSAAKNER